MDIDFDKLDALGQEEGGAKPYEALPVSPVLARIVKERKFMMDMHRDRQRAIMASQHLKTQIFAALKAGDREQALDLALRCIGEMSQDTHFIQATVGNRGTEERGDTHKGPVP